MIGGREVFTPIPVFNFPMTLIWLSISGRWLLILEKSIKDDEKCHKN